MSHRTPRMHNRPHDPAYEILTDDIQTKPKVHRKGCYICEDMEYARMGLPLCNPCCKCRAKDGDGHIPADDPSCEDCEHDLCDDCLNLPAQAEDICTCDTPCCEVDVGVGTITCGSQHCPTHGEKESMEIYQSKPARVAAVQWTGENKHEIENCGAPVRFDGEDGLRLLAGKDGVQGWVPVPIDHWIVRRPFEFDDHWPVSNDYFIEKYAKVGS